MGELGVLFNPGMRHEREEKLAKQMLREDEGTGRKGRLGIDLDSGVVVIGAGESVADAPSDEDAAAQPASSGAVTRPERVTAGQERQSAQGENPQRPPARRPRAPRPAAATEHAANAAPASKAQRRERRGR